MSVREIVESPWVQGEDESIAYTLTTTPWGSDPTSPAVVVKDLTNGGADVTETVTSGDASADGDVITTPAIGSLTAGHRYRVEVTFTIAGNVQEAFGIINAEV